MGGAEGEEEAGCQKLQLFLLIHPVTMPLFQLIKPHTMKGSGTIPPIELSVRHYALEVGDHLLPDKPLLSIHHNEVYLDKEGIKMSW